ncbi:hypothetical protein PAPHI01_1131 [Pancytospora philotis]|nr:hypothetical protein PAPHI01_1131 [Pancytospora philotis]
MGARRTWEYERALEVVKGLRKQCQPKNGHATPTEIAQMIHGFSLFIYDECCYSALKDSILYGFFFTRDLIWLKNRRFAFERCCKSPQIMAQCIRAARAFSPLKTTPEDVVEQMRQLGIVVDAAVQIAVQKLYTLERAKLQDKLSRTQHSGLNDREIFARFLCGGQLERTVGKYRIPGPAIATIPIPARYWNTRGPHNSRPSVIPESRAEPALGSENTLDPQDLLRHIKAKYCDKPISIWMIRNPRLPDEPGRTRPSLSSVKDAVNALIDAGDLVPITFNGHPRVAYFAVKIPRELRENPELLYYYARLRQHCLGGYSYMDYDTRLRAYSEEEPSCRSYITVRTARTFLFRQADTKPDYSAVRSILQALVALSLLGVKDESYNSEAYYVIPLHD